MNEASKEYRLEAPSTKFLYIILILIFLLPAILSISWVLHGARNPVGAVIIIGIPTLLLLAVFITVKRELSLAAKKTRLILSPVGMTRIGPKFKEGLFWNEVGSVRKKSKNDKILLIEVIPTKGRHIILTAYENMAEINDYIRSRIHVDEALDGQPSTFVHRTHAFLIVFYGGVACLIGIGYFLGTRSAIFSIGIALLSGALGFFFLYWKPLSSLRPDKTKLETRLGWFLLIIASLDLLTNIIGLLHSFKP